MNAVNEICKHRLFRVALCMVVAAVIAVGNVGCQEIEDFTTGFQCGTMGLTWDQCVDLGLAG